MDRRDVGGLRVAPPHGAAAAASLAAGCGWGRTTLLAAEERELVVAGSRRRVQGLEAALARLRAEKEAAERAAAALQAELESEQRAAETAATEAMRMIARLQREKAAAMIEAHAFRRVAESQVYRVHELQDRLADACALAASYYREFRRAHGVVDPDDDEEEAECCERQEEEEARAVERVQADVDGQGGDVKGVLLIEEPSPSTSPSPSPAAEEEEFEDKYAVDVTVTKPAAEEERVVAGSVVGELCLYARVQVLEADSAAVRREVAALRAERAQAALGPRLLRRDDVVVAPAAEKRQSFSVLAIFKLFFSTILRGGMKGCASAARKLPSIISSSAGSPTTYFLLGLLPLLSRSKGALQIQSKTERQPVHSSHGLQYLMLCYFFHHINANSHWEPDTVASDRETLQLWTRPQPGSSQSLPVQLLPARRAQASCCARHRIAELCSVHNGQVPSIAAELRSRHLRGPCMDCAALITASTSVSAWSRTVYADAEVRRLGLRQQRVDELEAAVARLRAEKEAAERAAAALRAELETERGATETATNEALLMIGRLQREKGAAMIEAREFRRIVEGRADHDRELQDELDAVHAIAASYEELLRAHGIDPDEESGHRVQEGGDTTEAKGVVVEEEHSPSPSPPPAAEEFEYKYAVDVRCAAVAEQRVVAGDLRARVEALEADSAEVRHEVAALRAERALVALSWEVTRRVCREAAAARAVVVAAEKPRFSVLAAFKWFFSTILCGTKRSASAARLLRNHPSSSPTPGSSSTTTYLLRGLLPLLERSKGTLQIQSKISGTGNGDLGFPCPERPWCTPL